MTEHVLHDEAELAGVLALAHPLPERHLGELLVEADVISRAELEDALQRQRQQDSRHLGELLVETGAATDQQIREALADKFGIPIVRLADYDLSSDVLALVPPEVVLQYNVLPLGVVDGRLIVAMENPLDWEALAAVRFNTNQNADAVLCPATDISRAIARYYSKYEEDEALQDLRFHSPGDGARRSERESVAAAEREAAKTPIVRMFNAIVAQAITRGASDINIRPEADRVDVYYRIDGKLQLARSLHKSLLRALVSRVKITGQMDIAEHRLPQDGHARIARDGNTIDLRISVIPTINGESVVVRILDKQVGIRRMDELGFGDREMIQLRQLLAHSYGMFLVTGPTGSGKSTTLYAILNEIRRRNPHVITVEDPVEYDMTGVEQIQVSAAQGYTFAEALRHILRHDPDVVMVGEIRDLETARIANKAALTGHLVLSTLHTNDAASAVTRLVDMGVEPYLLSATLLGTMAQRLVRLNCPRCVAPEPVDSLVRQTLRVAETETFYRGRGCPACNQTGYHGRVSVCELLPVTPEIGELVTGGRPAHDIKRMALSQGMEPLTENALRLAREGRISLEEVFNVRLD